jgi:hypothetical protein
MLAVDALRDSNAVRRYPIGSGAAEGTCRNLVKDRLELAGMKYYRNENGLPT